MPIPQKHGSQEMVVVFSVYQPSVKPQVRFLNISQSCSFSGPLNNPVRPYPFVTNWPVEGAGEMRIFYFHICGPFSKQFSRNAPKVSPSLLFSSLTHGDERWLFVCVINCNYEIEMLKLDFVSSNIIASRSHGPISVVKYSRRIINLVVSDFLQLLKYFPVKV